VEHVERRFTLGLLGGDLGLPAGSLADRQGAGRRRGQLDAAATTAAGDAGVCVSAASAASV